VLTILARWPKPIAAVLKAKYLRDGGVIIE
jgi:hypothetical protein